MIEYKGQAMSMLIRVHWPGLTKNGQSNTWSFLPLWTGGYADPLPHTPEQIAKLEEQEFEAAFSSTDLLRYTVTSLCYEMKATRDEQGVMHDFYRGCKPLRETITVMLACKLPNDPPLEKIHLFSHNMLPLPQHGSIGKVYDVDDAQFYQYDINQLPARAQALQKALQKAIEELSKDALFPQYVTQDFEVKWKEIQRMAYSVAEAYGEWHNQQVKLPTTLFPLDKPARKQRPYSAATFNDAGYAPIAACQPVQALLNAISNAASGGDRWAFNENDVNYKQVPYFAQTWASGSKSTILYSPDDSIAVPDNKVARQLWNEVKQIDESMADIMLDVFSHLSRNLGEDGATWFFASDHLDNRGLIPKMQADTPGGKKRRAGHRREDMLEISATLSKLQNLWLTIHQFIDEENERSSKKRKRKKTLYTHKGRLLMVEGYWYQNELTGEESDQLLDVGYAIGWKIRPGEWLKTFLEWPNRQVAQLCKVLIEYDPYRERHEKRIGRYIMFHGHMQTRGKGSVLTRRIRDILAEVSLLPEKELPRNAMREKERFEKAMDILARDRVIDGWRYAVENASLPEKRWFPTWLDGQVQVFIAPARRLIEAEECK